MKKYLNTLYVTSENAYLSLDGECVLVDINGSKNRLPLHNLESIICFSYKGASPALMGKCANMGIQLTFFTPYGKYLASTVNYSTGNVHLRMSQYKVSQDSELSMKIVKNMIYGKIYNSRQNLLRCMRDHKLQVDIELLRTATESLKNNLQGLKAVSDASSLRGIEGNAAETYFSVFNELILQSKDIFRFDTRSRRPPLDNINALLSFSYTLLATDCASALYSVGLDPFVGLLHTLRPGRKSLALDLEEELRPAIADRFVLYLINNRIVDSDDFERQESGAVYLTDSAKKRFLSEWQTHKKDSIKHPFLDEKVEWGLIPYIQALLLARYLREDLDSYPVFFYR